MKFITLLPWIIAVIIGTIAPIIFLAFHIEYDNTLSENSGLASISKSMRKLNTVVEKSEHFQQSDSEQRMKGKLDPFCGIDQEATLNVTRVVLKELEQGFFAVARENANGSSSSLDAVCVSEPTVLECLESGFASLLLMTLDHISYCRIMGIETVVIQWRNCQTACTKDPSVDSWPAYFESSHSGIELEARKVICLGGVITGEVLEKSAHEKRKKQREPLNEAFKVTSLLDVSFRKRTSLPGFEDGALITYELRDWARRLLNEHVRPKKSITSRVETFYLNHMYGFTVLGVHARGTDHWLETENHTLPLMDAWIQDAEVIFQALGSPKKIFLASDNYEIIDRFVEHFGKEKVVYTEARRAQKYTSKSPVTGANTNDVDPIELGSQILVDILLLAKCGHFLHSESSVASLASYFNPEMELYDLGYVGTDEETSEIGNSVPTASTFSNSSEDRIAEWEDGWNQQLEALQKCFVANSPFSMCPDMAKGRLIARADVETFLSKT